MPKGIPLTREEQARRQREIFTAAMKLFVEKGFNETTMREIADAASVGKSTLYDYFPTKDDILLAVIEEELHTLTEKAREIAAQSIPTGDKFRKIIYSYFDYLAANEHFFMKLSLEVQRMAQISQARIQKKRHAYQDLIGSVIEEGIEEGYFRPIDPLLAARIILTALTPAIYTTRKTSTRDQMMDDAFSLLLNGLQA